MAFFKAIDNYTTKQSGENGHTEYSWSISSIEERICQFNFQCVRTTDSKLSELENILTCLLVDIRNIEDKTESLKYLNIIFKSKIFLIKYLFIFFITHNLSSIFMLYER